METGLELTDGRQNREWSISNWLYRRLIRQLAAAGVMPNGKDEWSPRIHRPRAFWRAVSAGTLGAGEAYVDGDWDCNALDVLASRRSL
jgi:hypothetical protein